MEEADAQENWCPFTRLGDEDGAAVNRVSAGKVPSFATCLGSKCMAWRWERGSRDFGYCGLAGEPHA